MAYDEKLASKIIDNQAVIIERMISALTEIANRRNILKPHRNEYEAGYTLGTELCCDIADGALEPPDA